MNKMKNGMKAILISTKEITTQEIFDHKLRVLNLCEDGEGNEYYMFPKSDEGKLEILNKIKSN